MTAMNKRIKKIQSEVIKLLKEYSPVALLMIVLPFFIPIEREMTRRILLLFCAAPGLLTALINPKVVFRNPVHLLTMLFVAYFSAQHLRGMLPLNTHIVRMTLTTAIIIIFPVITLSFAHPNRKLYPAVLRLLLALLTVRIGYELLSFYAEAPFPVARFARFGHPVLTSWKTGFATVLATGLFLQSHPRFTRRDWLPLICLPLLLLATLYTHTRGTALALLVTTASLFPGIQKRLQKTVLLLSIIAGTICIYTTSMCITPIHGDPDSDKDLKLRRGGLFGTSSANASARFDMWKDHLSRMNTPKDWLIGHGLGMNVFVEKNITSDGRPLCYYSTPYGFTLNSHNSYIWALYHGGIMGLGFLLLLIGTAGWIAFRTGINGIVPLTLLVFTSSFFLVDGSRLLTGKGGLYLCFWIPLSLAAGLSEKDRLSPSE